MPLYVESLNDVLAVAGSSSFEGGQVSGVVPNLISNNAVSEALNMTITPSGNFQSRLGIETMSTRVSTATSNVQGMFYFDTPTIEQLLVATNGTLYRSTGSNTFATTNGTHNTTAVQVEFAQLNNKAFYVDGVSELHYTDGTSSSRQGGSISSLVTFSSRGTGYATAPTVTIGTPNLSYGVQAIGTASITGGSVSSVTITNAGSGYTSAPTVTFSTGSGGSLATATLQLAGIAPSGLRLIKSFTNRIFAVGSGTNRNTLYASDLLDTEVFKATNSIIVGGDDGEDIVAIEPYYGFQVLVFKPTKIYFVTADPASTTAAGWTVETISNRIGCVAGRTVAFVNKDVYFLSNDGIRSVSRSMADDFSVVGVPVSEGVKDVIARINRNFLSASNAVFNDNRYLLAVPLDSATTCSHILVYNAIFNSFEGLWDISASRMVETNFSSGFATNGIKLALASPSGRVGHYLGYKNADSSSIDNDADFKDYGTSYTSRIFSKGYDFDDKLSLKAGSHYEIEFYYSGSTNATISMRRDTDSNDVTLGTGVDTTSPGGLTLPLTLPATLSSQTVKRRADSLRSYGKWRNMRFKVEAPSRKLSVRSLLVAANPDTIEVQNNIS